jgi:hypothetical protein
MVMKKRFGRREVSKEGEVDDPTKDTQGKSRYQGHKTMGNKKTLFCVILG